MQKFIVSCVAIAAFAFSASALAKDGKPMTAQQEAFANCAHQSKGIKGDAHKKFMSDCLKGKSTATADAATAKAETAAPVSKVQTQREKMKTCNADAKSKQLKGADRKVFMSDCLKGDSSAAAAVTTAKAETAAPVSKVKSQREKMKTCNADAKSKQLKGADRKAFMSTCLKAG